MYFDWGSGYTGVFIHKCVLNCCSLKWIILLKTADLNLIPNEKMKIFRIFFVNESIEKMHIPRLRRNERPNSDTYFFSKGSCI